MTTASGFGGAFLGRVDLKSEVMNRLRDRSRGPLPPPRLGDMCESIAIKTFLPGEGDVALGWPQDVLDLVDTLASGQDNATACAFVEDVVSGTPIGATLDHLPAAYLLKLLEDPAVGAIRLSRDRGGAADTLLCKIAEELRNWRVGRSPSSGQWNALKADAYAQLTLASAPAQAPRKHFTALLARSIVDFDVTQATRWACQLATACANEVAQDPNIAATRMRNWQIREFLNLIQNHDAVKTVPAFS
ncbi:MAG: hypothetical protein JNM76_02450 [Betaproteobacteria bacterium]|nr:hypothetical protein [Betaproteobacteria bacterium]